MSTQSPLHDLARATGAAFTDEAGHAVTAHFGDPAGEYEAARAGAALFDQSHHGKLTAAGSEAASFLHNLSSNDVKNLPDDAGCEAFLCTATGRVVAHLYIFSHPAEGKKQRFSLDVPPGQATKVLAHLDRYLISEDVELADHTAELAQLHVAGPGAAEVLHAALGQAVDLAPLRHRAAGPGELRRRDLLGVPGYDLLCTAEAAPALWERLRAAGARPAGRDAWEVLRVEAGTPAYGIDMDESTFAPEVGRIAQAISYTKGCYLGQEPIVMARDRGVVQRTLVGLKLEAVVPSGTPLAQEGKEVGKVTSCVVSPRLGAVGLGYIKRGSQEPGTVLEAEGLRAEVAALPQ
jgi:folate-binding protein YgfZ